MKAIVGVMVLAQAASAAPGMWTIPASGEVIARLSVEADLGRHHTFEPLSLAPDVAIGLSERVGLVFQHSRAAAAELGAGNGLCLIGPHEALDMMEPVCRERQSGLGATALVELMPDLIGRVGLIVRDEVPLKLAAAIGLAASAQRGRWWVIGAPTLVVGMTERDAGNLDRFQVPIYGGLLVGAGELHLRTGIDGTIRTFEETFAIPVGVGASIDLGPVRLGADATLDKAFGPLNATSWRSAAIYVETRVGRS